MSLNIRSAMRSISGWVSGLKNTSRTAPSPESRPNFLRFSATARLLEAMYVSTLRGEVQTRQGLDRLVMGQGRGA